MEEITSFASFRAHCNERDRLNTKTHILQQECHYYDYNIRKQLKTFFVESSIQHECPMRQRYSNLLQKSL